MAETLDTDESGNTDAALKTVKRAKVTDDGEREASPADECHPDVWDDQGRLISHTAFTEVR